MANMSVHAHAALQRRREDSWLLSYRLNCETTADALIRASAELAEDSTYGECKTAMLGSSTLADDDIVLAHSARYER